MYGIFYLNFLLIHTKKNIHLDFLIFSSLKCLCNQAFILLIDAYNDSLSCTISIYHYIIIIHYQFLLCFTFYYLPYFRHCQYLPE